MTRSTAFGPMTSEVEAIASAIGNKNNHHLYKFGQTPEGREILRERLRVMHGLDPKNQDLSHGDMN